jgi:prevent-host-death family protein
MTRLSTSDARGSFADLIGRALYAGERVILERHGKPVAAVIPMEDLHLLEALEDREDVRAARGALRDMKRRGEEPIPLADVKKALGL